MGTGIVCLNVGCGRYAGSGGSPTAAIDISAGKGFECDAFHFVSADHRVVCTFQSDKHVAFLAPASPDSHKDGGVKTCFCIIEINIHFPIPGQIKDSSG